jgi:long-subunit acyl-CoA synthetase (AMP-forming)
MRKRILQAIEESWHLPVFEHMEMSQVFKRILTIYNMLDVFELDTGHTVALYGKNSFNWICIYIACLLKGVRLLVIHPNMNKIEVAHITLITNTNHIFIDDDLVSVEVGRNIFLKTLISIESLIVVMERSDKTYYTPLADVLVSSENSMHVDLKTMKTLFDEEVIESSVITATSGTQFGEPKWVESSTSSIEALINKSIGTVPFDVRDKVFSASEFAESHYLTVLLPFVKACIFVGNREDAEVFIEDTNSIEDIWSKNVSQMYGNKLLSFVFTIQWLRWLFQYVAVRRMRRFYGKKLEKIIIYNSTASEDIILTLAGKLPIFTTYGSQETNQLVAINNFSTEAKRKPGAVGTALPGLYFNTFDDQLTISGKSLFSNYVGDALYTRVVRSMSKDDYDTGDIGFFESSTNVLYVYGRAKARAHNGIKMPIQLDKIERIIKSIPYVKDCILLPVLQEHGQELILFVYPDINFVEAKNLRLLRLKELFKVYLNRINSILGDSAHIDDVVVSTEPLLKTHDGKICRYFYS